MFRRLVLLVTVACLPAVCAGGSVLETFRQGILGVPWGASLDRLVSTYPQGDHVFAVTPGCRAYWVKDGQMFLGIPRERNGVIYGLDEHNRVAIAAVAFEFERKLELRNVLTSLFGVPIMRRRSDEMTTYQWKADEGMSVGVREFGQANQQIIWLSVQAPGYKGEGEKCR
jgi:hypothetical protein